MEINKQKKMERIEFRVSSEEKELLQQAQAISGLGSLSAFVSNAVHEKATQVIKDKERILLTERDKEVFFQAISEDSAPNEALLNAAQDYIHKFKRFENSTIQ